MRGSRTFADDQRFLRNRFKKSETPHRERWGFRTSPRPRGVRRLIAKTDGLSTVGRLPIYQRAIVVEPEDVVFAIAVKIPDALNAPPTRHSGEEVSLADAAAIDLPGGHHTGVVAPDEIGFAFTVEVAEVPALLKAFSRSPGVLTVREITLTPNGLKLRAARQAIRADDVMEGVRTAQQQPGSRAGRMCNLYRLRRKANVDGLRFLMQTGLAHSPTRAVS